LPQLDLPSLFSQLFLIFLIFLIFFFFNAYYFLPKIRKGLVVQAWLNNLGNKPFLPFRNKKNFGRKIKEQPPQVIRQRLIGKLGLLRSNLFSLLKSTEKND